MFHTIFVSFFIYVYLTVLLRLFGKKEFSQLNVFDFVVFLIISEIMTMGLDTKNMTLKDSVIATATLIVLDKLESFITMKSKKLRDIFEGQPCYIIKDGKIQYQNMKKLRYSVDDLSHHLRVHDIDSISKVAFAVLETNGSLSVIKKDECDVVIPDTLISDGTVNDETLNMINKDLIWLRDELTKRNIYSFEEVFYCILEKDDLYIIKK